MTERGRAYVEFTRVDLSGHTRRILIPAGICVTGGASMVCFSAAVHAVHAWKVTLGFVGAAAMLYGLLSSVIGMYRLVQEDDFVAVTEDALVVRVGTTEHAFAWTDIAAIRADGGALTITLRDRPAFTLRALLAAPKMAELAARLDDWRRKAAWKLAPSARD